MSSLKVGTQSDKNCSCVTLAVKQELHNAQCTSERFNSVCSRASSQGTGMLDIGLLKRLSKPAL